MTAPTDPLRVLPGETLGDYARRMGWPARHYDEGYAATYMRNGGMLKAGEYAYTGGNLGTIGGPTDTKADPEPDAVDRYEFRCAPGLLGLGQPAIAAEPEGLAAWLPSKETEARDRALAAMERRACLLRCERCRHLVDELRSGICMYCHGDPE